MKRLCIYFIILLSTFNTAIAQEIPVPESLKTVPNSKCYWSYSVERLNSKDNSFHKYSIRVSVVQYDSNGKYKWDLKLRNAKIYCCFEENGILKKIYFKQVGKKWIAKFKIHTNEVLPLEIKASYNNNERIMPLKLNEGTYPGEPDN